AAPALDQTGQQGTPRRIFETPARIVEVRDETLMGRAVKDRRPGRVADYFSAMDSQPGSARVRQHAPQDRRAPKCSPPRCAQTALVPFPPDRRHRFTGQDPAGRVPQEPSLRLIDAHTVIAIAERATEPRREALRS